MNLISSQFKVELPLRWQKIQQMLTRENADACLISTNVNIFYVAGQILGGFVYIPREGHPWFFIRRPIGLADEHLVYIRKVEQIPDILKEKGLPLPQLLMLEDEIPYGDWVRYEAAFGGARCVSGTTLLRQVRSVKTDYEVLQMKQSAHLQSEAYKQFPSLYREGMTDHDYIVEMERCMRQLGSLGMFRVFGSTMEAAQASVLAGSNAEAASPYDFALGGNGMHPSLPIGHNGIKLEKGMAVMVDFGGNFNGYVSDMTRVFSVGKLTQRAYDAHQVSLEIQQMLAENGKPGAVCEDLYITSLQLAEKYGFADCFMGLSQQAKFVGHGVGLVVNELPVLCGKNREELQPNMIIALEPKFIITRVGAVGTENTYVVRDNGMEKITIAPEEIIDIS